ncbi:hypothetical protein B0I35DRAFT_446400 [Stachybotrys elegans]|uniref:Uncharacterized protein n=1 Tax=Stachybotrys elegans TaxID=80388 RepID=A0A8K0SDJ0_9HYPO|nr:hypothetical protein B0I35DRAFT_446400 [Stachybotrys elegans]
MVQPEGTRGSDVNDRSADTDANRSGESVTTFQSTISVVSLSAPTFGSSMQNEESQNTPDETLENAPQNAPETITAPLPTTSDDTEAYLAIEDEPIVPQPAASPFVTATNDSPPRIPSAPRSNKPVLQPHLAFGQYESDKEIPKSRKRLLCCTVM